MPSVDLKLLRQIKGNQISNCNFFNIPVFCQGRPLWLFAPDVKKT